MNESKNKPGENQLSNSAELFENLFREAPIEEKTKTKPPARGVRGQESRPVRATADRGRGVRSQTRPAGPLKAPRPALPGQRVPPGTGKGGTPEGLKAGGASRPSWKKENRRSRLLKFLLLVLLIAVGAAVAANYRGFIELGRYAGWVLDRKVQPSPPQAARSAAEKKTAPQPHVKPIPERPKAEPSTPDMAPPAGGSPPSATQPQPPAGTEERSSSPALQETPAQPAVARTLPPSPLDKSSVQAQAPKAPSYPFSVYLGSFANPAQTRTAVAIYENKFGIPSYWVKVDLKDKGTWYRLYTGTFQTAKEAEAFIREKKLKEGEVRRTRYSVLAGLFPGPEEAEETVKRLADMGFSPYTAPLPGGEVKVYCGVFSSLEGAKEHLAELAGKGVKGKAVER